jgi:hypothetical protein
MYTPETPRVSETSSLVNIHECFAMFFFETLGILYSTYLLPAIKPRHHPKKMGGAKISGVRYGNVYSIL